MSEKLRKQFEEETGLIAQIDGSYNRTYTQWLEDELEQRLEAGQHETIVMPIEDNFNGDNEKLKESIGALIRLNDKDALTPHGIGGHARGLLAACYSRL